MLQVEHLADGLKVYMRTPMAYLVADRVGPVGVVSLSVGQLNRYVSIALETSLALQLSKRQRQLS